VEICFRKKQIPPTPGNRHYSIDIFSTGLPLNATAFPSICIDHYPQRGISKPGAKRYSTIPRVVAFFIRFFHRAIQLISRPSGQRWVHLMIGLGKHGEIHEAAIDVDKKHRRDEDQQ